jgi:CelD/BcsL family acetyltransferase involved in cellulose biosynthesis
VQIEVIGVDQLRPDHLAAWVKLHQQNESAASPFLRPEYVIAVGRARANVEIAVLKTAGEYVGFFPFERGSSGLGRAVGQTMCDGVGIVTAALVPVNIDEVLRACSLSEWRFEHLNPSQLPFQPYHSYLSPAAYIDISEGFDVYRDDKAAAGSKAIQQSERKLRKMSRELGPVRLELDTADPQALEKLLTFKSAQMARKKYPDVFQEPWLKDVLQSLCGTHVDGFSGLLSTLYAGDRIVAVHVGLQSHGLFTSWIPAYDMTLANYSPGLIMHVEIAKRAPDLGINRIDLGRGINQLKSSLMSGVEPLAVGSVKRPTVRRSARQLRYRVEALARKNLSGIPRRLAKKALLAYRSVRYRSGGK